MLLRSAIYICIGLILTVLAGIFNTRFGWSIDPAWILVCAAAFAFPPEVAPISGLVFGMVLDGLSGTNGFYTLSYSSLGLAIMFIRKVLYFKGFFPAWITAIIGAEALWLFFGVLSRAANLLGGNVLVPGYISPYLISVAIGFPFAWLIAQKILVNTEETSGGKHYGLTTRMVDRT